MRKETYHRITRKAQPCRRSLAVYAVRFSGHYEVNFPARLCVLLIQDGGICALDRRSLPVLFTNEHRSPRANTPRYRRPRLHEIGIDSPVLLFTLGLAFFVSLVIGMIPVLKYSGITASTGLREGGRGLSQSRERHRARNSLVVVQVALALVLLICSGLMIRTSRALARISPGFSDPNSLQSFAIYIPESQIPETQREQVVRTEQAIADQIAAIPGVSAVGLTTNVPMSGLRDFNPVYASDRTYKEGELAPMRTNKFVSPGYFSTMGIPLIAGRDITWRKNMRSATSSSFPRILPANTGACRPARSANSSASVRRMIGTKSSA